MPSEISWPLESVASQQRTYHDVCRERGHLYPLRRGHAVRNVADRRDYLIVAYAMMTKNRKDALARIIGRSWTEKGEILRSFKWVEGQLGLWGIFQKVLSFDNHERIVSPAVAQIESLLLEIQDIFEPKKPIWTTPETFLGMEIVDPRILGAMGVVKTRHAPVEPIRKVEPKPLPEAPKISTPLPVTRIAQKVTDVFHPKSRQHPQFYPPVRPFRWSLKLRETPRPYIPPTPLNKPVHAAPLANAPIPTKIETPLPLPEFSDLSQALSWLREQKQWSALYQEIERRSFNEISLRALLQTKDSYLLRVLVRIQSSFSCPTINGIIHDVLQPLPAQSAPVPIKPVPETTALPPEPSPELKLSPEHEREIKRIFSFHKAGKYAEFWNAVQGLSETETLSEIRQAQEVLKQKDLFRTIAFIAWHELTEKDSEPYRTHTWNQRIVNLPHVRAQWKRLLEHREANKMKVIKELLGTIDIKIPAITTKDQEWMGFNEIDAPKSNLLAVIQALIKLDWEDPESTKKILRKLKQILWIPVEEKKA